MVIKTVIKNLGNTNCKENLKKIYNLQVYKYIIKE